AVDVAGAGEITDRQLRGLDPADPADLGDIHEGREAPSMVAFGFKPLAGNAPRSVSVSVSRYTPKAVLVANVEEARYEALAGEDGKILVRARYAVRNNQRAFLAVKLPAQTVLWSAALDGKTVRPGLSADGGYLLPLLKGRAGETAPTFAVELVYLMREPAWTDKGSARFEWPAVDLPVSRTGLLLHYSPRFAVEAQPGLFRVEPYLPPWSAALAPAASPTPKPQPRSAAPAPSASEDKDAAAGRMLFERFRRDGGKTTAGVIPVPVTVPEIGPSLFAAAELTAESQAPVFEITYKRANVR
ncbi:MAG TPA: hypothetical protein VFJ02_13320, partial [Vicinamibacterales bacterium]|nr:hypothetical protein [Vicinamibacterales bacterium]